MNVRPAKELYRQVSFLSYYFHWQLDALLELPHFERERFCREVSRMNREANGQEKDLFDVT